MAVIRVSHERDYTVISNVVFKDKKLSLKARGLLATMLSLPPNWDFTINGLVEIVKDGESAVRSAIKELEDNHYLVRNRVRKDDGSFAEMEYILYEKPVEEIPVVEKPIRENPIRENPVLDNQGQLNTKELSKKELSKKELSKKELYGEYENVKLTVDEYMKLSNEYGSENTKAAIKFLDEYIEEKGYKSKSNYLAIRRWVMDAVKKNKPNEKKQTQSSEAEGWLKYIEQ